MFVSVSVCVRERETERQSRAGEGIMTAKTRGSSLMCLTHADQTLERAHTEREKHGRLCGEGGRLHSPSFDVNTPNFQNQIGRASCRERV